jgi:hypothetical protein
VRQVGYMQELNRGTRSTVHEITKLVVLDWAAITYEWILTLISYVFVTRIVIDTIWLLMELS